MISLAVGTSILTILFCAAVLVQSVRLDRALRAVQTAEHGRMVETLDEATRRAETAVRALRDLLAAEGSELQRQVGRSRELSDELSVMVGLADAAAERVATSMDALTEKKGAKPAGEELGPSGRPILTIAKSAGTSGQRAPAGSKSKSSGAPKKPAAKKRQTSRRRPQASA